MAPSFGQLIGKTRSRWSEDSPQKPRRTTCSVPKCSRDCWSIIDNGTTLESPHCHKHSCGLGPGICNEQKRSKEKFCQTHSICTFSGCDERLREDPTHKPFPWYCDFHECRIEACYHSVTRPTEPFCTFHTTEIIHGLWLNAIYPPSLNTDYSPPPQFQPSAYQTSPCREPSPPTRHPLHVSAAYGELNPEPRMQGKQPPESLQRQTAPATRPAEESQAPGDEASEAEGGRISAFAFGAAFGFWIVWQILIQGFYKLVWPML